MRQSFHPAPIIALLFCLSCFTDIGLISFENDEYNRNNMLYCHAFSSRSISISSSLETIIHEMRSPRAITKTTTTTIITKSSSSWRHRRCNSGIFTSNDEVTNNDNEKMTTIDGFSRIDDDNCDVVKQQQQQQPISSNVIISQSSQQQQQTRRLFLSRSLLTTTTLPLLLPLFLTPSPSTAQQLTTTSSFLQFQPSPINKRSGRTLTFAESFGYTIPFVTYLSRFLLNFDSDCQKWWYARGSTVPSNASFDAVEKRRRDRFAAFSASVEVGLQEYGGGEGPERLMMALLRRYCGTEEGEGEGGKKGAERMARERKEARRQIALLFGLMERNQPTAALTTLLASIDNASVTRVEIVSGGGGYAPGYGPPGVTFPEPEAEGGEEEGEYKRAMGRATLGPSGRILRVDVVNRGSGYVKPPTVTIAPPPLAASHSSNDATTLKTATAKASIFKSGPYKGQIRYISIIDPGAGYFPHNPSRDIKITISPPETTPTDEMSSLPATAVAILDYKITGVKIVTPGSGYAAEKVLTVDVDPPPTYARYNLNDVLFPIVVAAEPPSKETGPIAVVTATATSETNSFKRFRKDSDIDRPSLSTASTTSTFGATGVGSDRLQQSLLSLLPEGYGLEYDGGRRRYRLTLQEGVSVGDESVGARWEPRDPDFGPRGRSPIERDKVLDFQIMARFFASGATCCSIAHVVLTPLDVVKTKIQTNPTKYPSLLPAITTILSNEPPSTFLSGWLPTLTGYFAAGGVQYTTTEFLRRFVTERVLGPDLAIQFEIPLILFVASVAASLGAVVISPFEAVRIRSVADPTYQDGNAGRVLVGMVREEGIATLFNSVPAFLFKDVPLICAKFLVFYKSTATLYEMFPSANDDLKLSLLISLTGGALGGAVGAIVSNPADVTISEMKKSAKELGTWEAVGVVWENGGVSGLFRGLGLRIPFLAFLISLQFLLYDFIRFSLGVGSDDLKLYLNVLGGALEGVGGPV